MVLMMMAVVVLMVEARFSTLDSARGSWRGTRGFNCG